MVYKNKQGAVPIKKEEYVQRITEILGVNPVLCESLVKANKPILARITEELELLEEIKQLLLEGNVGAVMQLFEYSSADEVPLPTKGEA